ncbi:MAG: hypothetical protein ACJ739_09610 [Acidimicrobiales bacterium]
MAAGPIPEHLERLFADRPPAPDFMGVTLDRARARAEVKGIVLRVVEVDAEDGAGTALTMDLRTDRLNVLVARGVVVRAGYF